MSKETQPLATGVAAKTKVLAYSNPDRNGRINFAYVECPKGEGNVTNKSALPFLAELKTPQDQLRKVTVSLTAAEAATTKEIEVVETVSVVNGIKYTNYSTVDENGVNVGVTLGIERSNQSYVARLRIRAARGNAALEDPEVQKLAENFGSKEAALNWLMPNSDKKKPNAFNSTGVQ